MADSSERHIREHNFLSSVHARDVVMLYLNEIFPSPICEIRTVPVERDAQSYRRIAPLLLLGPEKVLKMPI